MPFDLTHEIFRLMRQHEQNVELMLRAAVHCGYNAPEIEYREGYQGSPDTAHPAILRDGQHNELGRWWFETGIGGDAVPGFYVVPTDPEVAAMMVVLRAK